MPDETTLKSEALELVTYGNNFIAINDQDDFALANDYLKQNKAKQKAIADYFDPEIEAANKVHKGLCSKKKAMLEPLVANHATVTNACSVYLAEQERLRREEQARLDAIEKKKTEDAQAAILAEAGKEEKAGDLQGASDLIEQAADLVPKEVQAPPVVTTYRTPAGTTSWVSDLEITVLDPDAVYAAAKAGQLPIDCVAVDVKLSVLKSHFKGKGTKEFKGLGLEVKEKHVPRSRV